MYHQGGPLPLQGRPSGLPSAMDRQFQSRVDPRLLSQQMPQQAMQAMQQGYQHPMYGGNMRQQQQSQRPLTPQQMQQMSPQMKQHYQQMQAQVQAQQRQMQQMQMQQQAAAMAAQQRQQMQSRAAQMQQQQMPGQMHSSQYQQQFNPAMQPATASMPSTMYNPNAFSNIPGNPLVGNQPQFDSQGNPIMPESLQSQNTSLHGSGKQPEVGKYNQHEQYSQAKQARNLNPKEHLLFVCPSKCQYSAAILKFLNENDLLHNFMVIDLADPRISGIPSYITSVPTLFKPKIQKKFTEEDLKQWIIGHFGNPMQSKSGFRNTEKQASQAFGFIARPDGTKIIAKDLNLRPLGDITGDGNDIFEAMTYQGAPLSNDKDKYEVKHTTILEGSLSKFDDINKGVNDFTFTADKSGRQITGASGGFVTPGEVRPSDKPEVYDPNLQKLKVSEPESANPGQYITGNPFEIKIDKAKEAREAELQRRYEQIQQERAQDMQMRPNRKQQQINFGNFGY